MAGPEDLDPAVLAPVRAACLALPEVREEPAWIGVRWQVRRRTFAHLLPVDLDRPRAFARSAGLTAPAVVLTFRSADPELHVLRAQGPPFFAPPWGPDVVGLVLDDRTDPTEVVELLTESFLVRAPRALREVVLPPGE